jgi:hypothetical protein
MLWLLISTHIFAADLNLQCYQSLCSHRDSKDSPYVNHINKDIYRSDQAIEHFKSQEHLIEEFAQNMNERVELAKKQLPNIKEHIQQVKSMHMGLPINHYILPYVQTVIDKKKPVFQRLTYNLVPGKYKPDHKLALEEYLRKENEYVHTKPYRHFLFELLNREESINAYYKALSRIQTRLRLLDYTGQTWVQYQYKYQFALDYLRKFESGEMDNLITLSLKSLDDEVTRLEKKTTHSCSFLCQAYVYNKLNQIDQEHSEVSAAINNFNLDEYTKELKDNCQLKSIYQYALTKTDFTKLFQANYDAVLAYDLWA